jgi:hypothetical protein
MIAGETNPNNVPNATGSGGVIPSGETEPTTTASGSGQSGSESKSAASGGGIWGSKTDLVFGISMLISTLMGMWMVL